MLRTRALISPFSRFIALLLVAGAAQTAAAQDHRPDEPTVSAAHADTTTETTLVDIRMSDEARREAIERWKAKNRRRNPTQRRAPAAGAPRVATPAPIVAVQPAFETAGFQLSSTGSLSGLPFSTIEVPYQTGAVRTSAPGRQPIQSTSPERRQSP